MKATSRQLRKRNCTKLQKKLKLVKGKTKYITPQLLTKADADVVLRAIDTNMKPSQRLQKAAKAYQGIIHL